MQLAKYSARLAGVAIMAAAGLATTPAQATEGYFQHGYGAVSKFLAGAGVAYSQDAAAQILNPAGLVGVDNQVNVDLSLFGPRREISASGGLGTGFVPNDTVESDSKYFVIPNIAASYQIDDVSALGVALYGNGGMNTDYDDIARSSGCPPGGTGVFCAGTAGVDLMQAFLQVTYAREVIDGVSVGAGPILAFQRFEAKGISSFAPFSSDPANLSDNGHDESFGFGARFGVQAELPGNVGLGIAYQMRTYMDEFDDYKGLFAEQGDFDIPPALQVGVSWKPVEDVTLLFDYRRIWYSTIDSVGNEGGFPAISAPLGDDDGPGFGWEDADIFKIAAQWAADDRWTLRAGYSYTDQPIPSSEVLFNILAPAVIKHHFTAGVTYQLNESHSLHLGGFYAPEAEVSGSNPFDPSQEIELKMYQFEITAGWAMRF
jgi:long-chain fatty acid transport protein